MLKKILLIMMLALTAMAVNAQHVVENPDTVYTVHSITQEQFKQVIADYAARDWVMLNERPVVVDFYADWCQPCKRLEPILRDVAHHYQGEVDFYRINVDENSDIADVFQIRSIPYLLICPLQGEPMNVMGLFPAKEYIRVINQALGRQ
jgi:thioredoxin